MKKLASPFWTTFYMLKYTEVSYGNFVNEVSIIDWHWICSSKAYYWIRLYIALADIKVLFFFFLSCIILVASFAVRKNVKSVVILSKTGELYTNLHWWDINLSTENWFTAMDQSHM